MPPIDGLSGAASSLATCINFIAVIVTFREEVAVPQPPQYPRYSRADEIALLGQGIPIPPVYDSPRTDSSIEGWDPKTKKPFPINRHALYKERMTEWGFDLGVIE